MAVAVVLEIMMQANIQQFFFGVMLITENDAEHVLV